MFQQDELILARVIKQSVFLLDVDIVEIGHRVDEDLWNLIL